MSVYIPWCIRRILTPGNLPVFPPVVDVCWHIVYVHGALGQTVCSHGALGQTVCLHGALERKLHDLLDEVL